MYIYIYISLSIDCLSVCSVVYVKHCRYCVYDKHVGNSVV